MSEELNGRQLNNGSAESHETDVNTEKEKTKKTGAGQGAIPNREPRDKSENTAKIKKEAFKKKAVRTPAKKPKPVVLTEKEKGLTLEEINLRRKRIRNRNIMYLAVISTTVVLIIGYFVYTSMIRLNKVVIDCKGDCPYTEEELIEGLGLKENQLRKDIDKEAALKAAVHGLPYLENVEISVDLSGKVHMSATARKPMYYTTVGESMYILSDDLVVLENTSDIEKIEANKLKLVEFSQVSKCVVGEKLSAQEDEMQIVSDLAKYLEESEKLNVVTNINVSNRFEITMNCGPEYLVKLGDGTNLEYKVKFFAVTYENEYRERGIIDVSNPDKAKVGDFK